uniref:E3 ubiquitin-protein ligase n=1 Tax=Plectus sambesii TaxID=2011161 RepID=A0A914VS21_9BILA
MPTHSMGSSAFMQSLLSTEDEQRTAEQLKSACDELKDSGASAFGSEWDSSLPADIREKCREVDMFIDQVLGEDVSMEQQTEAIEKCKTLIAQGQNAEEFRKIMSTFDAATKCGAVWESNAVAFRCATCGYNPCMSLCADCFQAGDHTGHDFNRFFSQAGGACDCGDPQVIREFGFCPRHGPNALKNRPAPPKNVVSVAEFVIPKLFVRLFLRFREQYRVCGRPDDDGSHRESGSSIGKMLVDSCSNLVTLIQDLINHGGPLRTVMADILLDTDLYDRLSKTREDDRVTVSLDWRSHAALRYSMGTLESICNDADRELIGPVLCEEMKMESLLHELSFWLARLYFPQKLVTIALSLLPVDHYQIPFATSFFALYPQSAQLLIESSNFEADNSLDGIGSRIIHISVQILSSESVCTALDDKLNLLRMLMVCTDRIIGSQLVPSYLIQDAEYWVTDKAHTPASRHEIVDCSNATVVQRHAYWSVVSDLHNALSHRNLTIKFLRDRQLLDRYCRFVSRLQGINLNWRVVRGEHVDYESRTYQTAFTVEWEASAATMWNLVFSIDSEVVDCYKALFANIVDQIKRWFLAIGMRSDSLRSSALRVSFHLPLHRHLAAVILRGMDTNLPVTLPDENTLRRLVVHPMRIQAARAEIAAGMWVRNGLGIRYQAFLYVQSHLCTAFADLDIALLQIAAANVNPEWFIAAILESFYLVDSFELRPKTDSSIELTDNWSDYLLEGALRLLSELLTIRANVGLSIVETVELEVATALCFSDKAHSQIKEILPEKSSRSENLHGRYLDDALEKLAVYSEPDLTDMDGRLVQGLYTPKQQVWLELFDPVFCRLRAAQLKDFAGACERYEKMLKMEKLIEQSAKPWPPYRIPSSKPHSLVRNVESLLNTPSFFGFLHVVLNKAVTKDGSVSETSLQLVIYLLTLAAELALSPDASAEKKSFIPFNDAIESVTEPWSKATTISEKFLVSTSNEEDNSVMTLIVKLLRMHSEKEKVNDFLKMADPRSAVVGDASFFISRLLALLHQNSVCRSRLDSILFGDGEESSAMDTSASPTMEQMEQKTTIAMRRAEVRKRQEQLMERLASRQKNIMNSLMKSEGLSQMQMDAMDTTEDLSIREYECVICNDSSPSSIIRPIGLIVRVQGSSTIGRSVSKSCAPINLLTLSEEKVSRRTKQDWIREKKKVLVDVLELQKADRFAGDSIFLGDGVEVKTCGHYAHAECHQAYTKTLRDDRQLRDNLQVNRLEYPCPMCRRAANALLPIAVSSGVEKSKLPDANFAEKLKRIRECLRSVGHEDLDARSPYAQSFLNFLGQCRRWSRRFVDEELSTVGHTLSLGVLKTNLQLLAYFGLEHIADSQLNRSLPIDALVHGSCWRVSDSDSDRMLQDWSALIRPVSTDVLHDGIGGSIPLLLCELDELLVRSSVAIISSASLTAHDKLDLLLAAYQAVLCAQVVQTSVKMVVRVSDSQLNEWKQKAANCSTEKQKVGILEEGFLKVLERFSIAHRQEQAKVVTTVIVDVNAELEAACSQIARLMAVLCRDCGLKQYTDDEVDFSSFASLHSYLIGNEAVRLEWVDDSIVMSWIKQLQFHMDASTKIVQLLTEETLSWRAGRLVDLPAAFDHLFAVFFKKTCDRCKTVPTDPCICLACGTLVCHRGDCCLERDLLPKSEIESHAAKCGDGASIFMSVHSTLVLIVEDGRGAVWGSVYLDSHGEEDRNLKRGKPLTLSEKRYDLLKTQWQLQSFSQTKLRWFNFDHLSLLLGDSHIQL